MSNLLIIRGPQMGMRFELGRETSIGRAPENHIQLNDPNVSRSHCSIEQQGIRYKIVDNNSKNGLLVNGEEVQEKTLSRNDQISVGNTIFLFNTDHDLKNTRFSDKRVYFTSEVEDTLHDITPFRDAALKAVEQRDLGSRDLLFQLSDLFTFSQSTLPEAMEGILGKLVQIFGAQNGCLLKWDPVSSDFIPLVVVSNEEAVALSVKVIHSAMEEGKAVLVSSPPLDKKVVTTLRLETGNNEERREMVALCAPMYAEPPKAEGAGAKPFISGLLYLQIPENSPLILHDVRLLESVATLTQVAVEHYELRENMAQKESRSRKPRKQLVGQSDGFLHVLQLVEKVAKVDSTVLITGETGTGKEMIAREIHQRSDRNAYPFIAVNCGAIPETLMESELFGYERGAFTGADRMRRGLIENSHGGTLFLDEIGEMALNMQTKLLRFLQDKMITRVGGHKAIPINVRVLAATNAPLEKMVRAKTFREDLFFRIQVFEIALPPLRNRVSDIIPLAETFLERLTREYHKPILGLSPSARQFLEGYSWPGNIRELQNAIERAVLLCDKATLESEHFPLTPVELGENPTPLPGRRPLSLAESEKHCILQALEACDWNQAQAARVLDIHRNTLRKKIQDLGLKNPALSAVED